jgi:hypothetical protein
MAASQPSSSASARGKAQAPGKAVRKKGKFRETMWFKKGELDEAAAAAAEGDEAKTRVDELPIEDRYKDDGTLTTADAERLTLRTGATSAMPAVPRAEVVPGERMGEDDLVSELKAGRTRIFLIALTVAVVAAMLLVYFAVLRH